MQTKNSLIICSVCMILLAACMVSTGCTSSESGGTTTPVVSTSPATIVATPSQTAPPSNAPATIVTTAVAQTVATTVTPATGTPANNVIEVSLNSAMKKTKLGTFNPKSGNNFIVVDLTIKNKDNNEDFEYTDTSFALFDKTVQPPHKLSPITSQVAGALNNPFTSGIVPVKSEKTGQVVFPVKENSVSYKFTVYDSKGTEIRSFDNLSGS